MEIRTYHGKIVKTKVGQSVVNEYYKGFLNDVYVFNTREMADACKERKTLADSYMMQSNYHWRIQTIKE
jgi:hypothetical protein